MAENNHASYAKVGFIVVAGIVATIFTLIYLGGMRGRGDETIVETYYDKGVSGLSVGSPVNMRGVKVGEVREISFVGVKYGIKGVEASRIYIKMALSHKALGIEEGETAIDGEAIPIILKRQVDNGLRVTVTSSGITGISRMELDYYPVEDIEHNHEEKLAWIPKDQYIPSKASLIDNFSDSATKVMNQINKMDLNAAWSNISASVSAMARVTQSAQMVMESYQGELERIVENLTAASISIREMSAELKRNPSLLVRERVPRRLEETAE